MKLKYVQFKEFVVKQEDLNVHYRRKRVRTSNQPNHLRLNVTQYK